jgi:ornithine cyclodeaminase/alanine dehydrogenase-like protein (mu-crystallin family)
MVASTRLLYLSRADVERVNLPMAEIIVAVELALSEKAQARTHNPPKHWIVTSEQRFFSAMSSAVPTVSAAGCKWQSGSSLNAALGLPYITGQLILNDQETGLPLAIMDSTWLTAQRTAAATAAAARVLAGNDCRTLATLGCGVQGRTNLEALRIVLPQLDTVQAYDIRKEALDRYAAEMKAKHEVHVIRSSGPRAAIEGADIIVTSGPIEPNARRTIEAGWAKPGALAVTLDYDCYWKPAALHAADAVFTDDITQIEHLRKYGYFLDIPPLIGEIGEVIAGIKPGRRRPNETIVALNLGVSVADITTARRIFEAAKNQGRGAWLPL